MESKKIFYNEKGWVCQRYPYDLPIDNDNRYIEVDREEYEKTLTSPLYYAWRVVDGQLVNVHYDDLPPDWALQEKKEILVQKIEDAQNFLSETDYVIIKINEARLFHFQKKPKG